MLICSKFDFIISILKPGHFPNYPNFSLPLKGLELGLYGPAVHWQVDRETARTPREGVRGGSAAAGCASAQGPSLAPALLQALSANGLLGQHGPAMRRHPRAEVGRMIPRK